MTTAQRATRGVDHYYWLTSLLAARGMQTKTCRAFAAVIFGIGAMPVLLIGSSFGPQGVRDRTLAVIIAVCALAMGATWLRSRWPTRAESALCVVASTVCIAVACVIQSKAVSGLLGATSFAIVSAFVACFHTPRLLAWIGAVATATLAVLGVRMAAEDPVLAACGIALIVLLNVFVAITCRMAVRLASQDNVYTDIEPLTGLPNRDAFYESAATMLGSRGRDDDRFLVVVKVSIDSFSLLTGMAGASAGNRALVAVGQALRENVRHNAILAHVAETEFVIADSFDMPDPSPLVERIRSAIAMTPSRVTASIGVVSTPLRPLASRAPHEVLDEIMSIATVAMHEARRAGGNQARYVRHPDLSVEGPGTDITP